MLRQRLLWPPPQKNGDSGPPPVGSQVDIVQATRLTNRPVALPQNCGLQYVDSGVRFDPQEFPDLSRKTQEKLATKIIEAGRTRDHGRTIKVKEYSSKARKRIRFACSREECGVTFQINFDSSRGHWYMKRNKGSFDHTCSALKACSKMPLPPPQSHVCAPVRRTSSPTSTSAAASHQRSSPPPPMARPLNPAPLLRRSSTSSLKRGSPEPALEERSVAKKTRMVRASSTKTAPRAASSRRALSRSVSAPDESYRAAHAMPREMMVVNVPTKSSPRYEYGSREVGHEHRPSVKLAPKPTKKPNAQTQSHPSVITSNDHTSDRHSPTTEGKSRSKHVGYGSSVAVSIYSDDPIMKESDHYHHQHHYMAPQVETSYADEMFSTTPPSPPRKVVCSTDFSDDMFGTPLTDDFGLNELPPVPRSCFSSHASLMEAEVLPDFDAFDAAEDNFDEAHGAPSLCTMESAKRALLGGTVDSPDTTMAVGATSRGGPKLEALSNELSMCSLVVSPLDIVNVGNWSKAAKEAQAAVSPEIHGDDNSSLSTNWSLLAHDLKVDDC